MVVALFLEVFFIFNFFFPLVWKEMKEARLIRNSHTNCVL